MKKQLLILWLVAIYFALPQFVDAQTWTNCSTSTSPTSLPFNGNLVTFKSHWFYFGQVWHGELLMNNSDANFNSLMSNNVKYSIRHYNDNNLGAKFSELKQQLSSFGTDLTQLNTADGTTNDKSFWNARMSAGLGTLGENMLIGFVRDNNGAKECLYVTKKWKDLSSATSNPNFANYNDKILADRILVGSTNKAHVIINTQNTGCGGTTPSISHTESPMPSGVAQKVNHFLYTGLQNGNTNITLKYLNCSGGPVGGATGGNPGTVIIGKGGTIQPVSIASTTDLGCVGNKRKIKFNFTGGTGVYEMNQPGQRTYFDGIGLLDEFALVDNSGVFGKDFLLLDAGAQTIKVRDAQKYDEVTGIGDPANGDDAMRLVLPQMVNRNYTLSVNVPSCITTPSLSANLTSITLPSSGTGQSLIVTGQNLTGSWTISTNGNTWITPSVSTGGNGNTTLSISATVNTSSTTRGGSITISGGGASSVTIPVSQNGTVNGNCYRLQVANYASSGQYKPITLNGSILNLNDLGDNTSNSIWKTALVDGINSKIVSATNENIAITIEGSTVAFDNIVNVANYTGAGNQKWLINQDAYGNYYLRSSLNNSLFIGGASGQYGGGDADPNTKDLKLKSDLNWGANKWVMQSVTCPVPSCNYTLSNNTQSGIVNGALTLNPLCNGTDCSGVSYSWSGNGQSGNGLNITLPSSSGTYNYTVSGSKVGCNSLSTIISVTVSQVGTCTPVTSITSGGVYKIKNIGANKFIRPNSNISNKLEVSDTDNNNTYSLITDGSGFKITNIATGKIVEIINGSTSPGGNAILATTNPTTLSDHQRFQFEYVSGSFKIKPVTVSAWNWGIMMETYTGSGEGGQIRQYGYSSPVADSEKFSVCQISASARISANQENTFEENLGVHIYPNPVSNILKYTYVSEDDTNEIEIGIYDMMGKKMKSLIHPKTGRTTKGEISVEILNQGSYIITIGDGVKKDGKRFIKE